MPGLPYANPSAFGTSPALEIRTEQIVGETVDLELMLMTNDYMTGEVVHVDRDGRFV